MAEVKRCRHGHPRTPENIYVAPDGARKCRTCRREAMERFHNTRRELQREADARR